MVAYEHVVIGSWMITMIDAKLKTLRTTFLPYTMNAMAPIPVPISHMLDSTMIVRIDDDAWFYPFHKVGIEKRNSLKGKTGEKNGC